MGPKINLKYLFQPPTWTRNFSDIKVSNHKRPTTKNTTQITICQINNYPSKDLAILIKNNISKKFKLNKTHKNSFRKQYFTEVTWNGILGQKVPFGWPIGPSHVAKGNLEVAIGHMTGARKSGKKCPEIQVYHILLETRVC